MVSSLYVAQYRQVILIPKGALQVPRWNQGHRSYRVGFLGISESVCFSFSFGSSPSQLTFSYE